MAATLWRRERGRLVLTPHAGQWRAWRSERRFVFVIAGTQSGKTSFGPFWLWREMRRRGPGDYLAVTATYDLFKLKMLPALRELFVEALGVARYRAADRVLEVRPGALGDSDRDGAGARVILRSAAAGGGLESATAKGAWLDECGQDAFTVETWEAVLRRLSLSRGRALATTTPYNAGWLKTQVHDRWLAGDPDIEVVRFASTRNPAFPREEYERARASMPAWRFRMFYRGEMARPEGLVYDAFDDRLHVTEARVPPAEWPRWVGIDFGAVHTALVWLAEDPESGALTAYRESLGGCRTTAEHSAAALGMAEGENVRGWFGGAPGETQQRMDFGAAGVPVQRPPVADVEAGIDRVTDLLRSGRLFVQRGLSGLLDEFGSYRRRLGPDGAPTEEIENRRAFHRLDALRYAVCGWSGGPVSVVKEFWR
ncbi:MAG TPA: hypothetical protein VLH79_16335 [Chthonomonadales bacterium]|nr:hypothetical protein [Chthonomonadales bacterium]